MCSGNNTDNVICFESAIFKKICCIIRLNWLSSWAFVPERHSLHSNSHTVNMSRIYLLIDFSTSVSICTSKLKSQNSNKLWPRISSCKKCFCSKSNTHNLSTATCLCINCSVWSRFTMMNKKTVFSSKNMISQLDINQKDVTKISCWLTENNYDLLNNQKIYVQR